MPFISTNTWVLKIIDGTLSHRMKALGGYALYDEAFAGAREDAFDKEAAAKRKSAANSEKPAATLHLKATTKKGKLICFGKIDYEEGAKFTIGKAPSGNKIAVPEEHAAVLRVDDVHCAPRAIRRIAQFGAQFGARFSDAQFLGAIL
jgi:hypothetical protein